MATRMQLFRRLPRPHRRLPLPSASNRTRFIQTSGASLPRRPPSDRENPFRSLCKLTLVGRTGSQPDITHFDNPPSKSLSLSVATAQPISTTDSETIWHKVFIQDEVPAFSFLSTLPKGSLVYVHGDMRITTKTIDGQQRQLISVNVRAREGVIRVLSTPRRTEEAMEGDRNVLPF